MFDWEVDGGSSSEQVLAILSHSPTLEVLDLGDVKIYPDRRVVPSEVARQIANVEQIRLPSLRKLCISGLPPDIPAAIFTRIHAPYINDFHWKCGYEELTTEWLSLHRTRPPQGVTGHLLRALPFQPPRLQNDDEGAFRRFRTELYFHASNVGNVFDLFMLGSVVAILSLGINSREDFDHFPLSLLDNLPVVRKLKLYSVSNTVEILSHLSRRSGPMGRWPCPMMTHLTITTARGLERDAVISFQRARYPEQMNADVGEMELPVPLVSLVVSTAV
ncbi:hypothetical protein FRB95_001127 [Tulasnella sp. JGI-2019a]|nr:hypothetical protein FRB95_001127 [Tulasnella sp. JGI-2019a]